MTQRVGRGIALLFHDSGTRSWLSGQHHDSAVLHPPGKTRYPFYRRLGGPQGRSELAENLVLIRIRSRTVQPAAQSLYRLSYPAHIYKYINKLKAVSPCGLNRVKWKVLYWKTWGGRTLAMPRSFGSVNREKVVLVRCVKWGAWGGGATDVEWTVGF